MAKKEFRRVKTLRSFVAWAEQFELGLYLFRGFQMKGKLGLNYLKISP